MVAKVISELKSVSRLEIFPETGPRALSRIRQQSNLCHLQVCIDLEPSIVMICLISHKQCYTIIPGVWDVHNPAKLPVHKKRSSFD